jgi:hypothetical protein
VALPLPLGAYPEGVPALPGADTAGVPEASLPATDLDVLQDAERVRTRTAAE